MSVTRCWVQVSVISAFKSFPSSRDFLPLLEGWRHLKLLHFPAFFLQSGCHINFIYHRVGASVEGAG